MDALSDYRRVIRDLIQSYAQVQPSVGEIQVETIFNEDQDHYELIYSGWNGHRRIHGSVVHLDIRDGKIWIQYDGTPDGVAADLMAAGIPPDRIVLGFKPPEVRPHTGFATA